MSYNKTDVILRSISHLFLCFVFFFSADSAKGRHIGLVIITYNQGNN